MLRKLVIFLFFVCIFMIFGVFPATAEVSDIIMFVNGQQVVSDVPPHITDDRTMVPLRFIAVALGADVQWQPSIGVVVINQGSTWMVLTPGDAEASVDGEMVPLEVPPEIIDGRIFVPLSFITKSLGCQIYWDPSTKAIYINQTDTSNNGGGTPPSEGGGDTTITPGASVSPFGLEATLTSDTEVRLTWDSCPGAQQYIVLQKYIDFFGPKTDYVELGTTDNTSFDVTGLQNGSSYSFYIEAIMDNGKQDSEVASIDTPDVTQPTPSPPPNSGEVASNTFTGSWSGNCTASSMFNGNQFHWQADLQENSDGSISGNFNCDMGLSGPVSGERTGSNTCRWGVNLGDSWITFEGTLTGDTMSGSFSGSFSGSNTLSGDFDGER
jgi:hypothetical protein